VKYYHLTNSLSPGQCEVTQKSSTYDVTDKKSALPKQKIVFRVQTRRLAVSFEGLNSSLPLLAPELRMCKATCDPVVLHEHPRKRPDAKVKKKTDRKHLDFWPKPCSNSRYCDRKTTQ